MLILCVARYSLTLAFLFFINIIKLEAIRPNCTSFFDCSGHESCCLVSFSPVIRTCSASCVGKACRVHRDCSGYRECCHDNVCTKDIESCGCKTGDTRCGPVEYCCKARLPHEVRACRHSCLNHPCASDGDCADRECCNIHNNCAYSCNLRKCETDSDCSDENELKCCDSKPTNYATPTESIKVCMYKCSAVRCVIDEDCKESECCGSNKQCTSCSNGNLNASSRIIIFACTIIFIIIVTTLGLICYCRSRGRCVIFKPRINEETTRLRQLNNENEASVEPAQNTPAAQILPPPPYSITQQPFPPSQNQEFPPLYRSQDL